MPQQDMKWETFTNIVERINTPSATVSLQGEGEPSLHPRFFEMAQFLRNRNLKPYTILNGSRVDVPMLDAWFPTFGVSVDSLDEAWAKRIGWHNLPKVLHNIDTLGKTVNPKRITIMTVDMGQPLDELRLWVKDRHFGRHIVQPLSPKADCARRYTIPIVQHQPSPPTPKACQYLERTIARFYTWQGIELPCVFMKKTTDFVSIEHLRATHRVGQFMPCCDGCQYLRPIARPVARSTWLDKATPNIPVP